MEDKVISFTKLGTVKNKNFELTYADFLDKLEKFIRHNIDSYKVYYNPYEECYEIIYQGVRYKVHYGKEKLSKKCERKDLVETLDRLVNLTKKQIADKEADKLLEDKQNKKEETILRNGDKGIFYSDEDKQIYLELKAKLERNEPLTDGLLSEAYDVIREKQLDLNALIITTGIIIGTCILGLTSVIGKTLALSSVIYKILSGWYLFSLSYIVAISVVPYKYAPLDFLNIIGGISFESVSSATSITSAPWEV